MPEGRESPPPERQTGAQLHNPPGSGKGTDDVTNKREALKKELEHLESNPKGAMDDNLKAKYNK